MPVKIKQIKTSQLTDTGVYIFVGRRKSGKTVNILSLLNTFKNNFEFGIIFCGSVATSNQYASHVPRKFIHDELNPKLLEGLIKKQEQDLKKNKCKKAFVLLDDVGFDGKLWRHKVMKKLFFNGRHYKLCIMIAIQYCKSIGPSLRSNTDYIISSREKSIAYRRKLYDEFNICFKTFEEFDKACNVCTLNFDSFVLANAIASTSNKIEDNVFYFKSTYPIPRFKVNELGKWWGKHNTESKQSSVFARKSLFKLGGLDKKFNF